MARNDGESGLPTHDDLDLPTSDPHFYDGIPEAVMLKRGMTQQERIDNGYWMAYQIALALEKRMAAHPYKGEP